MCNHFLCVLSCFSVNSLCANKWLHHRRPITKSDQRVYFRTRLPDAGSIITNIPSQVLPIKKFKKTPRLGGLKRNKSKNFQGIYWRSPERRRPHPAEYIHTPSIMLGSVFEDYTRNLTSFDPLAYHILERDLLVATNQDRKGSQIQKFMHGFELGHDKFSFVAAIHLQATDGKILANAQRYVLSMGSPNGQTISIVIDSDASISITGIGSDFVGKIKNLPNAKINGLNNFLEVKGIGTIEWEVIDQKGVMRTIRTKAYYIPEARIQLFSPKTFFNEQAETSSASHFMNRAGVKLDLGDDNAPLSFPYQQKQLAHDVDTRYGGAQKNVPS